MEHNLLFGSEISLIVGVSVKYWIVSLKYWISTDWSALRIVLLSRFSFLPQKAQKSNTLTLRSEEISLVLVSPELTAVREVIL